MLAFKRNCSKSFPRNCGKEGLASPQGLGSRRQVSPSPPAGKQAPERRQACAQFPWCISSGRCWQSSLFATRGGPRDLQNWSRASEVSLAKEIGTWLSESHPDFMPCSTGYSLQVWEEGRAGWLRWELGSPSGQVMACTGGWVRTAHILCSLPGSWITSRWSTRHMHPTFPLSIISQTGRDICHHEVILV